MRSRHPLRTGTMPGRARCRLGWSKTAAPGATCDALVAVRCEWSLSTTPAVSIGPAAVARRSSVTENARYAACTARALRDAHVVALLHALGERAVDRGVHHEQGRPRREERLLQVQHARRDDPRRDGRQHRLGQLEDVVPPDRVTELVVDAIPPSLPHVRPHAVLLSLTDRHYGGREEVQVGTTPTGGTIDGLTPGTGRASPSSSRRDCRCRRHRRRGTAAVPRRRSRSRRGPAPWTPRPAG